jgi:hypothetical protein
LYKSIWLTANVTDKLFKLPILKNHLITGLFNKFDPSSYDHLYTASVREVDSYNKKNNKLSETERSQQIGNMVYNYFFENKETTSVNVSKNSNSTLTDANLEKKTNYEYMNDNIQEATKLPSNEMLRVNHNRIYSPALFFDYEHILVNTILLNLLITRLIYAETHLKINLWQNLLEYMRTLKFQLFITDTYQMNRFKEDPYLFLKHGVIALYIHYDIHSKITPLVTTMKTQKRKTFVEATFNVIKNFLNQMLSEIDPINIDVVRNILEEGNIDEMDQVTDNFVESLDAFKELKINSVYGTNNVIITTEAILDDTNDNSIVWDASDAFNKDITGEISFGDFNVPTGESKNPHDEACIHPCIDNSHNFFKNMGGKKDKCDCCKKDSYVIRERCYCCTMKNLCVKGFQSKCKAIHINIK